MVVHDAGEVKPVKYEAVTVTMMPGTEAVKVTTEEAVDW